MSEEVLYCETDDNEKKFIFAKTKGKLIVSRAKDDERSSKKLPSFILTFIKEVFLPQGFPDSVHPDYVPYQIWDTVQAFASTIMGTLTTHSIMRGVGVGESTASPLAAAITWILKDGTGMIGRILFAWWNGTDLDAHCKKWRLFADILNDFAMGIELIIPYFSTYSTLILCTSTAMKSVVGVAGGATRAALTQHQALRNNLADVSAKDGSQETFVNLIASFLGILILSLLHDGRYIMELYVLLVAVHLYANYSAVKALRLNSVNEDRLAIIVQEYLTEKNIPGPEHVNKRESVFLFQNPSKKLCGFTIKMGVSLKSMVQKNAIMLDDLEMITNLFQKRKYLIAVDIKRKTIFVSFTKCAESRDVLRAYFHSCICGLLVCMALRWRIPIFTRTWSHVSSFPLIRTYLVSRKYRSLCNGNSEKIVIESILAADEVVFREFITFMNALENSNWMTKTNLLPIGPWKGSWGEQGEALHCNK
ncbi:RUS1 family protein C16orf58 homolog [Orussus abietinus]|uniref:RUS1 family protein C16orf58 homolog n=1 Tax=Orussus abietinus TaxID=222816 RepID=UPI000625D2C5|nr:RUS1 family protein C16orf58 homolog [Orussus abietinus]